MKLPDFYAFAWSDESVYLRDRSDFSGVGFVFSLKVGEISVHEVLITVFLFITAPVSAYMLAKAALHLKLKQQDQTRNKELSQKIINRHKWN